MLLPSLASARNGLAGKRAFHATTTSHSSSHVARGDEKRKSVSGSMPRLSMVACTLSWSQLEAAAPPLSAVQALVPSVSAMQSCAVEQSPPVCPHEFPTVHHP